jgi:hypothetical protein
VFLQAAIMLAVIAALARPALPWHPPRVTLIVDVSASMGARDGDGTRLDRARATIRPVLASLPRSARVRLIAAGAVPSDVGEFSRDDPALQRALEHLRPTAATSDLLEQVRDARVAGGRDQLIVVATDWHGPSSEHGTTRWLTVGHTAANLAVTSLAARRVPASPDNQEILASVRNFGASRANVELEISEDGRILDRRTLAIEAGQSAATTIRVGRADGVLRAHLATADALAVDNDRFLVALPRRAIRVLLVGGESFFVAQALASHPDFAVDTAASLAGGTGAHDLIVCDPCKAEPPGDAGVLVISTGAGAAPAAPLTIAAPGHPIAAALDVSQITASSFDSRAPLADAVIVLRAGGAPGVLAYERNGRRFVELRLDTRDSRLPLSTAFPVLIDNILGWLARRDDAQETAAGNPLRWHVTAGSEPLRDIEGPNGMRVQAHHEGNTIIVADTSTAGIYTADSAHVFAVNPVISGESDLSAAQSPAAPLSDADEAGGARPPTEVAVPMIVAALVLLAAEWWYRNRWAAQG